MSTFFELSQEANRSPLNRTNNFASSQHRSLSQKKSILKNPSGRNTPTKNVKFNNLVNVNQFYSSPEEKTHEILVNSPTQQANANGFNITLEDEIQWDNTQKAMEYKENVLDIETQRLEQDIKKLSKENSEISKLIENEKAEFSRAGYKNIEDKEIEQLILQNKSLQELLSEKAREYDTLKHNSLEFAYDIQTPSQYLNKINELEKENVMLEKQIFSMKTQYENEIKQFKNMGSLIFNDDHEYKHLEKEIEIKEKEIQDAILHLRSLDKSTNVEKIAEKIPLETILLIFVEFERLNFILQRKKEENSMIQRSPSNQRIIFQKDVMN